MMKLWRMKKSLVTLLLISVLMMTLKSSLEPESSFQQPSNTIEEHYAEIDVAIANKPSRSRVLRDVFSNATPTKKSTEKTPTVLRCGYDVSLYICFYYIELYVYISL